MSDEIWRETLDGAHEMAVLAAVEAGTPEDCADAALLVVLDALVDRRGDSVALIQDLRAALRAGALIENYGSASA